MSEEKLRRKLPSNCPICEDALLNKYTPLAFGRERLTKSCTKYLDHHIRFRAYDNNHDYIDWVSIRWNTKDQIIWYYYKGICILNTSDGKDYHIPFFEPDFSKFNRLKEKLKTYLVFS